MTPHLTDLFARFLQGLYHVLNIALRRNPVPQPMAFLLTLRLQRLRNRFLALLAQFRSGTLPPLRPSRAGAPPRPRERAPRPARPAILAPRWVAAMVASIPETAWLLPRPPLAAHRHRHRP